MTDRRSGEDRRSGTERRQDWPPAAEREEPATPKRKPKPRSKRKRQRGKPRMTVWLDADLLRKVKTAAHDEDRSISSYVAHILASHLQQNEDF